MLPGIDSTQKLDIQQIKFLFRLITNYYNFINKAG